MDLSCLNESQKKAVMDTEGAVLVFAGAGSGKTRVLTYRVAHLISKGVNPWNILAITFTNKATLEMKERLRSMLGDSNDVWIYTFHALCAKILRFNASKMGYNNNFSIFNESATERTLKRVMREKHLEEKQYLDKIRHHISKAKNAGLDPDNYFDHIRLKTKDAMTIVECYQRYEDILKESNAMDFDDLLIKTIDLFRGHQDVLEYYQNRFQYIHVDEFQDTNAVQLELAKMLSGKHKNIFVVGDDDQSIYGWRGADVRNILDFENFFDKVTIHKLTQNYRSTQEILDVANNVICKNKARSEKKLFTDKEKGVKTLYKVAYNDHQEAEWVIENIVNLRYHREYKNSDIAILLRTNSLTRLFETKLRDKGIMYKVYGGYRFFDRKEIQDILAYLRMLINPLDNEAVTRIINFPKRGIGDSTVAALENYCQQKGISLFDGIMDIEYNQDLAPSIKNKLMIFKELLSDLLSTKSTYSLYDFVIYLIEKLELERIYSQTEKKEDENRWDNTIEFISHVKDFTKKNPQASLEEFLQTVVLESDVENVEDQDKLILGTMHSVKGLEFKAVFIAGCEEGIFPSIMSMNEGDQGIEEERRVMYVAITRAKERLHISCAQRRFRYNKEQSYIPSRFLYEAMGEQPSVSPKEKPQEGFFERNYKSISYDEAYPLSQRKTEYLPTKPTIQIAKEKVYNTNTNGFVTGAKVKHKRYGIGTIIVVEGDGMAKTATITFNGLGIKKFALSNAPLELQK